jgi:hypothetical protein
MSRMGAEGYSSEGQTQLSARVPEDLKSDFREACEHQGVTMTEAVESQMAEFVAEHKPTDTVRDASGYYPENERERALYEACLDCATDDLIIYYRRHASTIAQATQQVSKQELSDALRPLRRKGYLALGSMPTHLSIEQAKRWRHWHVKPACADPEKWVRREEY